MSKLEHLKKKARSLYIKITETEASYSCGRRLAEYINPDLHSMKEQFNEIWKQVRALDPETPPSPFSEGKHETHNESP